MSNLSATETEVLQQFLEVTNWDKDEAEAIQLLHTTNWNLETALLLHFEGGLDTGAGGPSVSNANTTTRPSFSSARPTSSLLEELQAQQPEHDLAPRINATPSIYSPRSGGFSIIQTVLFAPFALAYRAFNGLIYWLSLVFPFLPRFTGYYPANRNATHSDNLASYNPRTIAARLIRSFEERYGENDVPFLECGYTEALDRAKSGLKYLVIVLESFENDLTDSFNKDVLMNNRMLSFLKREDVLLWVGDVKESEAYHVGSKLQASKYPFMALIAPTPKTPTTNTVVMTVLARYRGALVASSVLNAFTDKIDEHQPKIMSLVLDKQERDLSRQLREEQDSAYERSLRADRERQEAVKKEAEEKQLKDVKEKEAKEQEKILSLKKEQARAKRESLKSEWRHWKAAELKAKSKETEAGNYARVSLRLSSGERIVHKFHESQSLEDLYAFVECYDLILNDDFDGMESEPEDYQHEYAFELVSPMPRKVLEANANLKVRDESTIFPNGSLVVELLDDDESDSDIE